MWHLQVLRAKTNSPRWSQGLGVESISDLIYGNAAFAHVQHAAMSMSCSLLFDIYLTDTNTCSFRLALLTTACCLHVVSVDLQGVGKSLAIWMCQAGDFSLHVQEIVFQRVSTRVCPKIGPQFQWFIILFCGKLLFGCPAEKTLRTFSCSEPGSPLAFKECRQWTDFLTTCFARHVVMHGFFRTYRSIQFFFRHVETTRLQEMNHYVRLWRKMHANS